MLLVQLHEKGCPGWESWSTVSGEELGVEPRGLSCPSDSVGPLGDHVVPELLSSLAGHGQDAARVLGHLGRVRFAVSPVLGCPG
eukprot:13570683-Alexandrium_andersonii.AAC.1